MTKKEKSYSKKYKKCSEVSTEECYMGGKNCGTCAHCAQWDSDFNYFENDYCTCEERKKMNREILFKAKRKDNGEWVEGLPIRMWGILHIQDSEDENTVYEIDADTLCQFTGLTDKNGRKIWENDILKFNDEIWDSCYTSCGTEYDSWEAENYGLVGYCDYSARYDFTKYKYSESQVEADLHENQDIEFAEFVKEHEVIGNICDNAELLEVE